MAKDEGKKGKLASRHRQVEKPKLCPVCGGEVEDVDYHATLKKGKPAFRCPKCKTIRLRGSGAVVPL